MITKPVVLLCIFLLLFSATITHNPQQTERSVQVNPLSLSLTLIKLATYRFNPLIYSFNHSYYYCFIVITTTKQHHFCIKHYHHHHHHPPEPT